MKKKNLIIICAVAVIGILALVVALNGAKNATFKQDYNIEDTAAVTRIYMADKQNNEVLLTRTGKQEATSAWLVDNKYPANQPMVDLLLETMNTMRIRQQVNRNAVPNVIKDISARGIKVEVYARKPLFRLFGLKMFVRDRRIVTYYVGRETQDMMASYMFREGDKVPYVIHIPGFRGFLTPRFVTEPLKWRSHNIVDLDVNAIARIQLEIPAMPEESFAVVNKGDGFDLEIARGIAPAFDTARVAQLLSSFTWLNFDEFAEIVPNSNDSSLVGAPRYILTITDTAGRQTELRTYIKYYNPADSLAMLDTAMYNTFDLDRLYAIINQKDTVLIQYYVFDRILQPASYFLYGDNNNTAQASRLQIMK
ncbi:MAG: DUF4340 domain-containing protein [Bacteroidales bacterium]|nr:DUF4340 domain-containing protein [Bacteroidales bacterium]